jgi:hypothetical protein
VFRHYPIFGFAVLGYVKPHLLHFLLERRKIEIRRPDLSENGSNKTIELLKEELNKIKR